MRAVIEQLGLIAALLVACSSPAPAARKPSESLATGGSVASAATPTSTTEGGAADVPPLTDEELGRLLDALEQEIGRE